MKTEAAEKTACGSDVSAHVTTDIADASSRVITVPEDVQADLISLQLLIRKSPGLSQRGICEMAHADPPLQFPREYTRFLLKLGKGLLWKIEPGYYNSFLFIDADRQ